MSPNFCLLLTPIVHILSYCHSNSSGYNILWYSRSVKSCGGSPIHHEYLNQRSRWSSLIMVGRLLDRPFRMVGTIVTLAPQPLLYLISNSYNTTYALSWGALCYYKNYYHYIFIKTKWIRRVQNKSFILGKSVA